MPQARVVFLHGEDDRSSPVWEHYCECGMLIHGISYPYSCGSELVRQVARIPSTTDSDTLDSDFADGFIAVVQGKFATNEGMQALDREMNSWWDHQKRTTFAQGKAGCVDQSVQLCVAGG